MAAPVTPDGMRVLLTGATGFVGRNLYPVLTGAGHAVRCVSRSADAAAKRWPEREWMSADLDDETSLAAACAGCDAAYFLVHGMGSHSGDFRRRERETAERFAAAAARAGLRRIVYLGGFEPQGKPTEHLQSRLEVGEILRSGPVTTIELRASMIVGTGSLSWLMVRDLAARLPAMVLPRWLKSRTQPVWIGDVLLALQRALELPAAGSEWYDLPGPQTLTGREILEQTGRLMGLPRPWMLEVPVLSPWLSSHWVRFVTRAEWAVAREVVVGMAHDFLAKDDRFWTLAGIQPLSFEEAVRRTLAEEAEEPPPGGFWGAVERRRRKRVGVAQP